MEEKEISIILEREEREKILLRLQRLAEQEEKIPKIPFLLLRRLARPLQYTGGILLGVFLGVVTLILNFILLVEILHLSF